MYLIQERNENCVNYRNINKNPRYHYSHLFFRNGNGVEFIDGNPVVEVAFNRTIPWSEYYKDTISLDELKERYSEYHLENDIEETFNRSKEFNELMKDFREPATESALWVAARKKEEKALVDIEEVTIEQITSIDYWVGTFTEDSYFPHLSLSKNFYKLEKVNENTEKNLLSVAIALVTAYVTFFEKIKSNKDLIRTYKPILGIDWTEKDVEDCYKTAMRDMKRLTKELGRISNYMLILLLSA